MSDSEIIVDDPLGPEWHRLFIKPTDEGRGEDHHPHDLRYETFRKDSLGHVHKVNGNHNSFHRSKGDALSAMHRLAQSVRNNTGY